MEKKRRLSIRIAACIAVMILIVLAFLIFSRDNEQRIMDQNMEYIQDSTMQMARQIDQVFSDGYENIHTMSVLLSQSLDGPEVDVDLIREITKDSAFDFIEFTDPDGMDHNITGGVSDATDRQYYLDGIKGKEGMEVVFNSRATHETLLMFYSPVTFDKKNVGVLIGVYQAENKMEKLLTTTYFGEQADLYLATPEGKVAASNRPLDTNADLRITDLSQGDDELAYNMQQAMRDDDNLNFTLKDQKSGGCMTKLPNEGWFLVQIFPEAANVSMIKEANRAGVRLEIMLLVIFFLVLVLLVYIHRKERREIEEIAEERGKYKNAVLADAIIMFEANLTKNQIMEGIWKDENGNKIPVEDILDINLPCEYDTYILHWADLYVEESDRELFLKNTSRMYLNEQFAQGKSEITFEYYAKSLEGKKIFVRRSTYLAADKKSGDVIAYQNVKDITEQKQREIQLHQYEQMLVMTTTEIYQGARQLDLSDFSTVYLAFEDDHITPRGEEDWNTWLAEQEMYVHPDDIEELKEKLSIDNLLKMPVGGKFRCDFRSCRKNQNGVYKVFSINTYKAERDGKLYVNLITMDITATVENERRQKALIEAALLREENANKAKAKFLTNMSHDIRTPMNAIIDSAKLAMTHNNDGERVQGCLEKIVASGEHLLSLVNGVLDISRIESGSMQLEETECNLLDAMHELENMLMPEMQSRNLEFHIDMEDVSEGKIIYDRLCLNQVLLNLLGNAMKFTEPGGSIRLQILEKPGKDEDEAVYEFRVKDNGVGMSKEFLNHLFEPFERERNSASNEVQGTGLGMPITKNIVEMMHGTISVTSEKGVGTEVTVQLLVKKVL